MGDRNRKKERQRLKRKKKREAARRRQSASPYQRLGSAAQITVCWVNRNWRKDGETGIYMLLASPGGESALVAFLVDFWCAGLKDAWGHLGVTRSEFDDYVDRNRARMGVDMVEVDPAAAKRWIAGGIRFANQNGFRLPAHYERWVAAIGGVGDPTAADPGDFGCEGGLRWIGTMKELRARLIGCSAEAFLQRKDVHFIMEVGPWGDFEEDEEDWEESEEDDPDEEADEDDDDGEDDDGEELPPELAAEIEKLPPKDREAMEGVVGGALLAARRLHSAAREWCFANNEIPHPRLAEAADLLLTSALAAGLEDSAETGTAVKAPGLSRDTFRRLDPEVMEGLHGAVDQLTRFMDTFGSAEEMAEAVGLPGLDDEPDDPE